MAVASIKNREKNASANGRIASAIAPEAYFAEYIRTINCSEVEEKRKTIGISTKSE